jgi:hypothetical protein
MRYYIGQKGTRLGPFEGDEIRARLAAGTLSYDDLVWREGMALWAAVHTEFPPPSPSIHPPSLAHGAPAGTTPAPVFNRGDTNAAPGVPVPGATLGLVLGIISMVAWLLPILGLPLSVWGLIAAIRAARAGGGAKATAGIVLNSLALALALLNAIIGAYLAATGQHPWMK